MKKRVKKSFKSLHGLFKNPVCFIEIYFVNVFSFSQQDAEQPNI